MSVIESLFMAPDAMNIASQAYDHVMILAQETHNIRVTGGGAPKFNIEFDSQIVNLGRVLAVICAVIWGFFAFKNFAAPSSKGGGGNLIQRIGGWGPLLAAFVFIAIFIDLNNLDDLINVFIWMGWSIFNFIRGAFGMSS